MVEIFPLYKNALPYLAFTTWLRMALRSKLEVDINLERTQES